MFVSWGYFFNAYEYKWDDSSNLPKPLSASAFDKIGAIFVGWICKHLLKSDIASSNFLYFNNNLPRNNSASYYFGFLEIALVRIWSAASILLVLL
jgi:hypothetical protein